MLLVLCTNWTDDLKSGFEGCRATSRSPGCDKSKPKTKIWIPFIWQWQTPFPWEEIVKLLRPLGNVTCSRLWLNSDFRLNVWRLYEPTSHLSGFDWSCNQKLSFEDWPEGFDWNRARMSMVANIQPQARSNMPLGTCRLPTYGPKGGPTGPIRPVGCQHTAPNSLQHPMGHVDCQHTAPKVNS